MLAAHPEHFVIYPDGETGYLNFIEAMSVKLTYIKTVLIDTGYNDLLRKKDSHFLMLVKGY